VHGPLVWAGNGDSAICKCIWVSFTGLFFLDIAWRSAAHAVFFHHSLVILAGLVCHARPSAKVQHFVFPAVVLLQGRGRRRRRPTGVVGFGGCCGGSEARHLRKRGDSRHPGLHRPGIPVARPQVRAGACGPDGNVAKIGLVWVSYL
jgi:hypothetical protein